MNSSDNVSSPERIDIVLPSGLFASCIDGDWFLNGTCPRLTAEDIKYIVCEALRGHMDKNFSFTKILSGMTNLQNRTNLQDRTIDQTNDPVWLRGQLTRLLQSKSVCLCNLSGEFHDISDGGCEYCEKALGQQILDSLL